MPSSSNKPITRLTNFYSNSYLEHRILKDLRKRLDIELKSSETLSNHSLAGNRGASPVIILGMHRSGTTLTSKILRSSGIHMGQLRGKDTDESLFFQNVNKAIFSLANSHWDTPEFVGKSLQKSVFHQALVNVLDKYCQLPRKTRSYFGTSTFKRGSFANMTQPWGWKDPRTCFTLPLWLKLFPEAKIVFIQRNGVDVAQSLVTRNKKLSTRNDMSVRTSELAGAFKLWEIYNEQCIKHAEALKPEQIHSVRYEDILAEPELRMREVFNFLEHEVSASKLSQVTKNIQKDRGFAFTNSEELFSFYKEVKDSAMMSRFDYSDI